MPGRGTSCGAAVQIHTGEQVGGFGVYSVVGGCDVVWWEGVVWCSVVGGCGVVWWEGVVCSVVGGCGVVLCGGRVWCSVVGGCGVV